MLLILTSPAVIQAGLVTYSPCLRPPGRALEGNPAVGENLIQRGARLDVGNKFDDTALSLAG